MASAQEGWKSMSASQQREVSTACVMVALGPVIKSKIPAVVSTMKSVVRDEVRKIESNKNRTENDEKLLAFLREIDHAPMSLEGIQKLENMRSRTDIAGLLPLAERCFHSLPSVLQFSGFGSLLQHNAVSKFISFALTWRYSGKGYEAPSGISAPFSGYDDIINSLMGHPLCKAEMEKQAKLWEKAHGKK